jgi:hypothetical protein
MQQNPADTAARIGDPLGTVAGATFYFSPQSAARGDAIGLDVVSLYAAGRGAVLGEVPAAEVDDAFFFFTSGMIAGIVEAARAIAPAPVILGAHLAAADDFARATFGAVDPAQLAAFDVAGTMVVDALPTGSWPLVDGYRAPPVPTEPAPAAFRRAILLRELRGGVHRDAVVAAGLSAAVACQFDRGDDYFRLHGFGDVDRVAVTPDVVAAKEAAQVATDARVGECLSVLDAAGLDALVAGALAMDAAWQAPVPVS